MVSFLIGLSEFKHIKNKLNVNDIYYHLGVLIALLVLYSIR
ncbi:hypothetical protein PULV_a0575 [Pseudoalteromonas ulvae UL12]|nr:hypothetical protein [Pseudoalteromonas ulvae UL12]